MNHFAAAGLAGGSVLGAGLLAASLHGLINDRDHWRAQALAPRPSASSAASTAPAAAPSSPVSSSSPGPPGFRALPVTAHPAATPRPVTPRPVTPRPTASKPRPAPSPSPAASCPRAPLMVVLPVSILPCNAIVIGGS